jgi:GT2 family glycosyltransferase
MAEWVVFLKKIIEAHDHSIGNGSPPPLDAEAQIVALGETIVRRDARIALLEDLAAQRQKELQALRDALAESRRVLSRRAQSLDEVTHERNIIALKLAAIENGAAWKVTYPLRKLGAQFPLVRRLCRGIAKLLWWTATGRLGRKLRERRAEIDRLELFERERMQGIPGRSIAPGQQEDDYQRWIHECDTLSAEDIELIRVHIASFVDPPLISVVIPVYETPENFLLEAIASVRAQIYPCWELCICDDASPSAHVKRIIEEAARDDSRIRWVRRERNGHICAATNDAIALAKGEYVALMDHDDLLPPHALYSVVAELISHPETDLLFTDEDRISDDGHRHTPYFKPGWNPELLLAQNFICHLSIYRRDLLVRLGGLREGFEGSQDHDLALRVAAEVGDSRIRHLPGILYHWRLSTTASELSFSQSQMDRCVEASRRAITEFLGMRGDSHGSDAFVVPSAFVPFWSRVHWPLPYPAPKVSIIVPTRDYHELLAQCVDGLLHRTDYENIEIIIADNDSVEPETLALFKELKADSRVRVLSCPGPFNYSAINNNAAGQASGEILVLLNNDIDVIGADWLTEMVSIAVRPEVGIVGAKLLYANEKVQHAGVALGIGRFNEGPGVAGHFAIGEDRNEPGYFGQNILTRDLSAVTAACMAVRRDVFENVGGLDDKNLAVAFNDVDFCLRVRSEGLRVIWSPYAELYHLESASRGNDEALGKLKRFIEEGSYMRRRWGELLDNDPFYNPAFSRLGPLFSPTRPSKPTRPWQELNT